MKKIKEYFKIVFTELVEKVTWPSWSELMNSAIVVMVASIIITIIVRLMDIGFGNIMEEVYKISL